MGSRRSRRAVCTPFTLIPFPPLCKPHAMAQAVQRNRGVDGFSKHRGCVACAVQPPPHADDGIRSKHNHMSMYANSRSVLGCQESVFLHAIIISSVRVYVRRQNAPTVCESVRLDARMHAYVRLTKQSQWLCGWHLCKFGRGAGTGLPNILSSLASHWSPYPYMMNDANSNTPPRVI